MPRYLTEQDIADFRNELCKVATERVARHGYEGVTMRQLAEALGCSPKTPYRYFKDKYAVLEALGRRLMDRQNEVLFAWLERHVPEGLIALADHTEDLLRATADVTAAEPGAVWTLRALRAVPQLAHVRIESHRIVTDRMVKAYAPLVPELSKKVLWRRVRISIEFGFAADEMLNEEDLIKRDDIIKEAARMLRWSLRDPD